MDAKDLNDRLRGGTLPSIDELFEQGKPMYPAGSGGTAPLKTSTLTEAVDSTWQLIKDRHSGKSKPILTPWEPLNTHLNGGLWPGLHVLVAPPKAGKTQFALQLAKSALSENHLVYYIGLELTPEEVVSRLYSLTTNNLIHWAHMLYGKLSESERETLFNPEEQEAMKAKLDHFRYIHETAYGWDFQQLRGIGAEAQAKSNGEPFLVIIDYLQLLQAPDGVRMDMRERIGRAAYLGRQLARDYGGVVFAISSTARAEYNPRDTVGSPWGYMGTGKESGEIEYAADSVSVIVREKEFNGYRFALAGGRATVPAWFRAEFVEGFRWNITGKIQPGADL